jgi:hypothetical protein
LNKHNCNICDIFFHGLHLQDLEREKAARAEIEKTSSREAPKVPLPDQTSMTFIFIPINLGELDPTLPLVVTLPFFLNCFLFFSLKEMPLSESCLVLAV